MELARIELALLDCQSSVIPLYHSPTLEIFSEYSFIIKETVRQYNEKEKRKRENLIFSRLKRDFLITKVYGQRECEVVHHRI